MNKEWEINTNIQDLVQMICPPLTV